MNLIEAYAAAVLRAEICDDPLQRGVIQHLQRVVNELTEKSTPSFLRFLHKASSRGLYLYGSVGVGKTYLMDLFYQSIENVPKQRLHFHHFMQDIDARLRQLQGHRDPLRLIARDFAKTTKLLCLDEFLVHDVAFAMILAELLQSLFELGVVIVATANQHPDELYLNGVHRERFLPAIDAIKEHCEVVFLSEKHDYRRGRVELPEAYFYPLTAKNLQAFAQQFDQIGGGALPIETLNIQNRMIPIVKCSATAVWFEFDVICNIPRCQLDYLEIAERFKTIFVSQIPILKADDTIRVLLLIHFVDVMYDRGIRLILAAEALPQELYTDGAWLRMFQRTLSRLEEMHSVDYLQRHVF